MVGSCSKSTTFGYRDSPGGTRCRPLPVSQIGFNFRLQQDSLGGQSGSRDFSYLPVCL